MNPARLGFRSLTVVASKGGTGKTTVALNLAVLAQARGIETVVLDADPQRSALDWANARAARRPQVVRMDPELLRGFHASLMRSEVSLLIVDTPPSGGPLVQNAVQLSDLNLLICRPAPLDVWAVKRAAEMARALGARSEVVINQAAPARAGREPPSLLDSVARLQHYGIPLAPAGLRYRVAFSDAMRLGQGVSEYAPTSVAADEMGRLWDHVAGQLWGQRLPPEPRGPPDPDPF